MLQQIIELSLLIINMNMHHLSLLVHTIFFN